jgi:hypothetical protein
VRGNDIGGRCARTTDYTEYERELPAETDEELPLLLQGLLTEDASRYMPDPVHRASRSPSSPC